MTRLRSDDGLVTGEAEFVRMYNNAQREQARDTREWIDLLRAHGVAAAHPDDGWVDRRRDRVMLCYPDFDDGVEIGSLIALGRPDDYRLVRATWRELNRFGLEWWRFEAVPDGTSTGRVAGFGVAVDGPFRRFAAKLRAAGQRLIRFVDRR